MIVYSEATMFAHKEYQKLHGKDLSGHFGRDKCITSIEGSFVF